MRLRYFRCREFHFGKLYKTLHNNPVTRFAPIAFVPVAPVVAIPLPPSCRQCELWARRWRAAELQVVADLGDVEEHVLQVAGDDINSNYENGAIDNGYLQ